MDTQLLPPLDAWDLEQLRSSIRDHGVQEPVVKDEFGYIIDGHHRAAIAAEIGADCPERVVTGLTDGEKQALAIMLNVNRRHLTIEQRREILRVQKGRIAAALTADPTRSDRSIAEEVGSTHPTVASVREELEDNGKLSILERRGRAEPVEKEPQAENFADHRNELYFEFTLHYPSPSDEIRKRGNDPFPKASVRKDWSTGTLYLTCEAPENTTQAAAMLSEAFQRVSREMSQRPLRTMVRTLV